MTQIVIQPSLKALHHRILSSALAALVLSGIAVLFFVQRKPFDSHVLIFAGVTCAGIVVLWLLSVGVLSRKWHKTTYVLAEEYLAVNKGAIFGVGKRRLYRYEAMASINVAQSRTGKRHDYGTIRIVMPKPVRSIRITYVPDPERQAVFVRNQIVSHQNA